MNHDRLEIHSQQRQIGKVYHFSEFKRQRPFFNHPIKITMDSPQEDTYYLIKNVVYKEKQILALHKGQDTQQIYLVEAIIEEGQLKQILKIPEENVGDIASFIRNKIG